MNNMYVMYHSHTSSRSLVNLVIHHFQIMAWRRPGDKPLSEPMMVNLLTLICITLPNELTHWARVTHICVGKLTIIGSDNGLSPERRQAIIWTNAGILLIGPLGTNCSEILIEIQTFALKKIRLKMSSAKCCSFRLGLNVLISTHKWMMHSAYELCGSTQNASY